MNNTAKTALVAVIIIVLILAGLYFFYDGSKKAELLSEREDRITQLETKLDKLKVAIENLNLQNDELTQILTGERSKLEEASKQAEILKAREERLKKQIAATETKLTKERSLFEEQRKKFEKEMKESEMTQASLEEKLRKTVESQDVLISRLKDKLTVNVASKILFNSGSSTLRKEGKDVLDKVALALAGEDDQIISVEGHTDNVPINTFRFPSNWDLSAARAIAAVRYLSEVCGIPSEKLTAVGYGEQRPIAPNDSKENKAKNRRIEIVLSQKS
ncbi:MAG: OmpA family protein [Verrucomicrobiota bacterium]